MDFMRDFAAISAPPPPPPSPLLPLLPLLPPLPSLLPLPDRPRWRFTLGPNGIRPLPLPCMGCFMASLPSPPSSPLLPPPPPLPPLPLLPPLLLQLSWSFATDARGRLSCVAPTRTDADELCPRGDTRDPNVAGSVLDAVEEEEEEEKEEYAEDEEEEEEEAGGLVPSVPSTPFSLQYRPLCIRTPCIDVSTLPPLPPSHT